jgi:hypothetical protein
MYYFIKLIIYILTSITLNEALELDIVTFTFTKTMGSSRIATGTRNLNLIPERFHPKGTGRATAEGIIKFFDWNKQQWRSCREQSVFGHWEIKNEDLNYRLETYEKLGISPE